MRTAAPSSSLMSMPPDPLAAHVLARRAIFYPKSDLPVPDARLRGLAAPATTVLEEGRIHARTALARSLRVEPAQLAVEPLAQQGTFHLVFRGGTVSEPGRWVVRLNRLPGELVDWQLRADAAVSHALAQAAVAHARVLAVDCTRDAVPTDFEVLEHLPGTSLSVHDADDAAIAPWLAALARLLRHVHAIPGSGAGFLDVSHPAQSLRGVHGRWDQYIDVRRADHVSALQAAGVVDAREASTITGVFDHAREALAAVAPRLLHGDPGNHNVIVREGGEPVLVDWEDALLGDPLFDVAFWATFHPERRWPAFLDAYFAPGWRPTWRFWLYFLRISMSKTVHRLRFGYTDKPGRPPAAARIQRALRGLDEIRGQEP